MRNYFVVRIEIKNVFEELRKEILDGRLRQHYGIADLRKGAEAFVKALQDANFKDTVSPQRRYTILSVLLKIKRGDIIVVPKVSINQLGMGKWFSVFECVEEYTFSPLPPYDDFGHIIGVKARGTFDYDSTNEFANLIGKLLMGISLSRAVNQIRNPETIQAVENLTETLPPPVDDPDSLKDKILTMQKYYLNGLLQAARSLPPDDPSRAAGLKKILETVRMLFPDALRAMIHDLFVESGRRLLSAENDFVFELFPERELMHDFYAADSPPKIFVRIKNPDLTLAENLAQFAEGDAAAVRLLICPNEELDDSKLVAAKERNVILVDGLTLANALANHKII